MGTSTFWTGRTRLFAETLCRLEDWLAAVGSVGSVDLDCIADESGVHPAVRLPTIVLQEEGLRTPTGEFLSTLAHDRNVAPEVHRDHQVAVRVCVPPFPFDDPATFDENSRNAAIVFDDDRTGGHVEDTRRVAGESGIVLVATGTGETMRDAQGQTHDRVDGTTVPNTYDRDDVGNRWIEADGDRLLAGALRVGVARIGGRRVASDPVEPNRSDNPRNRRTTP
jgi:phosphoribosylamine--glycine ligase